MRKRRSTQLLSRDRPPPKLNLLLNTLSHDDYERVARTLELIPLELKQVIHKPGDRIQHVYFPGGGFFSMLTVLEDGGMADAFRREMDRRGAFYEVVTRFGQALVGFIMQSTACNAMHSVEQPGPLALDGTGPHGQKRFPAHTGVRRDDARREPPDRDPRRRDAAENGADYVSARARNHRGA